jgi:GT2 family glycosyltransferase
VGAKLYYPDGSIQHAGLILGIGGVAGHGHKHFKRNEYGYVNRLQLVQNVTAVSAACLMVSKAAFDEVGGFDEGYAVAFNDVDFCMKLREAGYLNVFTPFAELYHHESKSRGYEDTPQKQQRFLKEVLRFQTRWDKELKAGDPYYNVNLTLEREDFSLKANDIQQ